MVPDHLPQLAVGEQSLCKTPRPSVLHLITTEDVGGCGVDISVYVVGGGGMGVQAPPDAPNVPDVECGEARVGCHGIKHNSSLFLQPGLTQAQGLKVTVLPQEERRKPFQGLCSYAGRRGTMKVKMTDGSVK